jgi:hypothetical protein
MIPPMGRCPIPRKESGLLDLGMRPNHAKLRMVRPHRSLIKNIKDPARGEAAGGGLRTPRSWGPPGGGRGGGRQTRAGGGCPGGGS